MSKQQKLGFLYGFPTQKTDTTLIYAPEHLSKHCEVWNLKKDFPELIDVRGDKIYILTTFKKQLFEAFTELKEKGLLHEIKTFDGAYNLRKIRGSQVEWSIHSWAAAIDMNATTNPLNGKVTWSSEFLAVMRKHVDCGADFKRIDGMHFEIKLQ